MINGIAKLIVDLGNSETRVVTMFGKNANGNLRKKMSVIPNRFHLHRDNIVLSEPINELNSSVFTATGTAAGQSVEAKYAHGLLVDREYQTPVRPTNLAKKYDALVSLLALHTAFLEGYRSISMMQGNVPIEDIDVEWQVTVLLPPQDMGLPNDPNSGVSKMSALIRSITNINFEYPNVQKEIRIVDGGVSILPEGLCAFMSVLFKNKGLLREGYESLASDNVLIVDIGGGTTDFLIVEGGQAIESSKATASVGGSNVESRVRDLIRSTHGVSLKAPQVRDAVITGVFRKGGSTVDCREIIAEAKRAVASQLVDELTGSFERIGYDVQSINQLLVVGGGAETSNVEGIEPISTYIVSAMKGYSPAIALAELPKEKKVDDEGDVYFETISPRILNIRGAVIIAQ